MEAYFALAKVGAVSVPLNWRLAADELDFILKDSGAMRIIYGEEFLEAAADLHSRGKRTEIRQHHAGAPPPQLSGGSNA